MKKIFKMFAVGLVAVTTLVSAGCSCNLKSDEVTERVNNLKDTYVYKRGNDYNSFVMSYIETNIETGLVTKHTIDAVFTNEVDEYTYTVQATDKTDTIVTKKLSEIENEEIIKNTYDVYKTQLAVVNSLDKHDETAYFDGLRKLIGLEDDTNESLSNINISLEASKELFSKSATFVLEYDVFMESLMKHRLTITVNGDNRITFAKLDLIGQFAIDNRGNREERTYNLGYLTVEYK